MAKNREVLCKHYANTEKNVEVPKNFMAFLKTLVIALTVHVRIMSIYCCPVPIFAINLRLFTTLQNMHLISYGAAERNQIVWFK